MIPATTRIILSKKNSYWKFQTTFLLPPKYNTIGCCKNNTNTLILYLSQVLVTSYSNYYILITKIHSYKLSTYYRFEEYLVQITI